MLPRQGLFIKIAQLYVLSRRRYLILYRQTKAEMISLMALLLPSVLFEKINENFRGKFSVN